MNESQDAGRKQGLQSMLHPAGGGEVGDVRTIRVSALGCDRDPFACERSSFLTAVRETGNATVPVPHRILILASDSSSLDAFGRCFAGIATVTDNPANGLQADLLADETDACACLRNAREDGCPYSVVFVDPADSAHVALAAAALLKADDMIEIVLCPKESDPPLPHFQNRKRYFILPRPFEQREVVRLAHALAEKSLSSRRFTSNVDDIRRRIQAMFNEMHDLIIQTDTQGQIQFMNSAGRDFFRLYQTAAYRKNIAQLYPPWAKRTLERDGFPSAASKGSWHGASAVVDDTGREVPASQWIHAFHAPGGEMASFVIVLHTLDRRATDCATPANQELLPPVGSRSQWIYDIETMRILAANAAAAARHGHAEDDLQSMTMDALLQRDDARYLHQIATLAAEAETAQLDIRVRLAEEEAPVTLSVYPGPALLHGRICRTSLVLESSPQDHGQGDLDAAGNKVQIPIVVVEDNDAMRKLIAVSLTAAGCEVTGVADSSSLYRHLLDHAADIVILDLGLPGEDGFSILRQLRSMPRTRAMGIIVLSGYGASRSRVRALEDGADLFLAKPVEMSELQAHVASLHRRLLLPPSPSITVAASWRLQRAACQLIAPSGTAIHLTHAEDEVLHQLARAAGQPVKRADLISGALLKDPRTYDERRLEALVSRLRKRIHKAYPRSQPIRAAHAVGYILTERVDIVS